MIALLALLLTSGGLMLLTLGVDVEAGGDGLTVFVLCGPWSFRIYPTDGKEDKVKEKKKKKEKREDAEPAPKEAKNKLKEQLTFDMVKKLLRAAVNILKRFLRALRIDLLTFRYTAAASDVSDAAIQYGYVNAIISVLYPILDNAASVRELDVSTSVDYEAIKPAAYIHIVLSVQVWEILYIGFAFVSDMLNMLYQDR